MAELLLQLLQAGSARRGPVTTSGCTKLISSLLMIRETFYTFSVSVSMKLRVLKVENVIRGMSANITLVTISLLVYHI